MTSDPFIIYGVAIHCISLRGLLVPEIISPSNRCCTDSLWGNTKVRRVLVLYPNERQVAVRSFFVTVVLNLSLTLSVLTSVLPDDSQTVCVMDIYYSTHQTGLVYIPVFLVHAYILREY